MRTALLILVGVLIGCCLSLLISRQPAYAQSGPALSENQSQFDPTDKKLFFEEIQLANIAYTIYRTWVPGGWLVAYNVSVFLGGFTFYPDPEHLWTPKVKEPGPWSVK